MYLNRVILYLTVIPWIFHYLINILKTLIHFEKKNTFSLFRVDSILLIFIFVYFSKFNQKIVIQMLFATMNLYFFINSLYEEHINMINLKKVMLQNKLLIFLLFLFMLGILLIFGNILKLTYFYYLLFIITFFINMIIYGLKKMKLFK